MKHLSKWICAPLAVLMIVGYASAADTVAAGKVKTINAEAKSFVLIDSADKDFTFKFGEQLIVNRAGKESPSDLKVGDQINVCYDKGIFTWTANYILVKEGDSKNCTLVRGTIKGYDAAKKEMTFADEADRAVVYPMGKATVVRDGKEVKIEEVKIGDAAMIIIDSKDGAATLRTVRLDNVSR